MISIAAITAQSAIAKPGDITPDKIRQIDEMLIAGVEKTGAKGVSVTLVQEGRIVFEKGYGVSGESGAPVAEHTAFHLASVTKTMTALVTLQLIEEGKLDSEGAVVSYLPDFRTRSKTMSDKITVRHLLNQVSGLTAYSGNRYQNESDQPANALQRNVARLENVKLGGVPGTRYEYSNSNFHVLGHLIETIESKPLEHIFRERIWGPFAMENSFAKAVPDSGTDMSQRYRMWFNQARPYHRPLGRGLVAAGGASSSSHDMGLYLIELLSDTSSSGTSDVKAHLFDSLSEQEGTSYQNGWFLNNATTPHLYHDGSLGGATSLIAMFPETSSGMVILSNTSIGLMFGNVRALEGGVQDIILEQPIRPLQPPLLYRVIYTLLVLIALFFTGHVIRIFMRCIRGLSAETAKTVESKTTIVKLLKPLSSITFGIALLIAAPLLFDTTLLSLAEFLPDVAVLLGLAGVMSIFVGLSQLPIWSHFGSLRGES